MRQALAVFGLVLVLCGCNNGAAGDTDPDKPGTPPGSASSQLAAAREPRTRISIYDLEAATELAMYQGAPPASHTKGDVGENIPGGAIVAVTFTPNGQTLVVAAKAGPVQVRDAVTLKVRTTQEGLGTLVGAANRPLLALGREATAGLCLALSPAGDFLAVGREDIKLVETATGKVQVMKTDQKEPIAALAFSPDGTRLVSASGSAITFWQIPEAVPVFTWPLPDFSERDGSIDITVTPRPSVLAFAPDGKSVLAASRGSPLVTWFEAAEGKEIKHCLYRQMVSGPKGFASSQSSFMALAVAPDGKTLAAAHEDGDLRLWDVFTGKLLGQAAGQGKGVTPTPQAMAFSPDGTIVVAGCLDGSVRRWEVNTLVDP